MKKRNWKNKIKKIISIIAVFILPAILAFVIHEQYKKITRTPVSYYKNSGIIDNLGETIKIYRSNSYRGMNSKTPTFFVKMKDNDTIYSFSKPLFNRNYKEITNKIKKGDYVKIYHEGFDERQNTVNIIQLENGNTIVISKASFDKKETILLLFFCFLFIITSLIPIYLFLNLILSKKVK